MSDTHVNIDDALVEFEEAEAWNRQKDRERTQVVNELENAQKAKAAALDRLADALRAKLGPHDLSNLLHRFRGHKALSDEHRPVS